MCKVTFHDHVSVENRDGVLDELASLGATIEVEAEDIYISTSKDTDEKFVRAFLFQDDERGTYRSSHPQFFGLAEEYFSLLNR